MLRRHVPLLDIVNVFCLERGQRCMRWAYDTSSVAREGFALVRMWAVQDCHVYHHLCVQPCVARDEPRELPVVNVSPVHPALILLARQVKGTPNNKQDEAWEVCQPLNAFIEYHRTIWLTWAQRLAVACSSLRQERLP